MTTRPLRRAALKAVQRSVPLATLAFTLDNLLASAKITTADPPPTEHLGGSDINADIAYARGVAAAYVSQGRIRGRVAEVGPGGSAAVALYLIAAGADEVDLVDRFRFQHDRNDQRRLYDTIIAAEPRLRDLGLSGDALEPRIRFHVGEEAAAERFFPRHQGYDVICSCAVLEHLYDPLTAISAMAAALNPGGRLLHQVDLRDHGMFSAGGHHDLTFLTLPTWLYPLLSRRRGRPNRVLLDQYRSLLNGLPVRYELLTTHLVGVGQVDPMSYADLPASLRARAEHTVQEIRPRLAREFRQVSVADLAVASVFIAAEKIG